jgi:alkylation response protein AidB-like acyl-CoA dehydrogenase
MHVNPDPLVERLGKVVRGRLAASSGPAPAGDPDAVAEALRRIDAFGYEAPVGAGGYDLGVGSGVVIAVEIGRACRPNPYAGPALLVDAIASGGDQTAHLLELARSAAAGTLAVGIAGFDRTAGPRPATPEVTAEPVGDRWVLSGAILVGTDAADGRLCLPVATAEGPMLALLPAAPRDRLRPWPVDGLALLSFDGVVVDELVPLGKLGTSADRGELAPAVEDPSGVLARARLRQAAVLVGLGLGAQAEAVEHATGRTQFDQRLVDFQAVRFGLAESVVALRAVLLSVYHAAWLADTGEPFAAAATEALAMAAETALTVTGTAMQFHGAVGLTTAQPISAYYRAVRLEAARFGPPERLWQEAGARGLAAGDPVAPPAEVASGVSC